MKPPDNISLSRDQEQQTQQPSSADNSVLKTNPNSKQVKSSTTAKRKAAATAARRKQEQQKGRIKKPASSGAKTQSIISPNFPFVVAEPTITNGSSAARRHEGGSCNGRSQRSHRTRCTRCTSISAVVLKAI